MDSKLSYLTVYVFRLASNYQSLVNAIGIKNPVHKQKLTVKATDVVLFGPPKSKYKHQAYITLGHFCDHLEIHLSEFHAR